MQFSCAFKSGPELIDPFTSLVLEMNVRWRGKHFNSAFLRVKALKIQYSLYIKLSTPAYPAGLCLVMRQTMPSWQTCASFPSTVGCAGAELTAQVNPSLGSKSQTRNRRQPGTPGCLPFICEEQKGRPSSHSTITL